MNDAPSFHPSQRVLLGPGPSDVPARVLQALGSPTLGHLDPEYLKLMDETRQMLRQVFRTQNEMTLAMSGTGSAGMETVCVNLLEPGDAAIVCVNGVFGGRMKDVMERCGARVHAIEVPWGETIPAERIAEFLKAVPDAKMVGIVHAETSTGAHQPLEEISKLVHDAGALLAVDAVTSLGGLSLEVDAWGIDACYSGTQKCLSCPPGLSPVTFSPRALARMDARKTKVQSWYLDMTMIRNYWGADRVYHHTAPINMTYALREALAIVLEEGLENRIARHRKNHLALRAGLEALDLNFIPAESLTTLNAIHVPEGVDEAAVRRRLLNEYGIEIGAGLGPFKGKALRIGLMGSSSSQRNVMLVLTALENILTRTGATAAAQKSFTN
ncbi:MAG TPA: alanine--glyoxylate aminotransferase family protein [Verrucomicrobiales bacterium]|jgi:alanine-glyoxylate transaminase/serine-glyoxylate transaminase/serine-pyruvate transaminase|nr:alanine--glyoxylate aminotransferase family protein [Verrucomicrobiales bacterium]